MLDENRDIIKSTIYINLNDVYMQDINANLLAQNIEGLPVEIIEEIAVFLDTAIFSDTTEETMVPNDNFLHFDCNILVTFGVCMLSTMFLYHSMEDTNLKLSPS